MAKRYLLLVALLAGLFSSAPLFVLPQGGDSIFHYVLIKNFAEQLWSGILLPQWCVECNNQRGSPVFLFYFPLPYYLTSIIYPVSALGFSMQHIYALSTAVAGAITFLSCYVWLRTSFRVNVSLAIAFLCLWMPYRIELLYQRSAFAELWALAFIPLIFWALKKFSMNYSKYWAYLCLIIAVCLLCHVPTTIIALGGGLFIFLVSRLFSKQDCSDIWIPISSAVIGVGLVCFHILPAKAMMEFLSPEGLSFARNVWSNAFLDVAALSKTVPNVLLNSAEGIVVCFIAAIAVFIKRKHITEMLRAHTFAWLTLIPVSIFLMLTASKPIWDLLVPIDILHTPWRLQLLIMLGSVYFFALYADCMLSGKQKMNVRMDYASLCILFVFMALSSYLMGQNNTALRKEIVDKNLIQASEYQTKWVDGYNLHTMQHTLNESTKVSAGGALHEVHIEQWNSKEITFSITLNKSDTIKIHHHYFPIWRAYNNDAEIALHPEQGSGLMSVTLPAGSHRIMLKKDLASILPFYARYSWIISLLSAVMLLVVLHRHRRIIVSTA
ncbi:MAG: hypothetical protein ACN2B6_03985 [Rickettsiales bacterium]